MGFGCAGGGCRPLFGTDAAPCNPPSLQCGANCSDIRNDNLNCGRCGNNCAVDRACFNGMCLPVCAPGQLRCNGACVDVQRDDNNCGGCGRVCGGGEHCVMGACQAGPGYLPVGPQENVELRTIEGGGWRQCYVANYDDGIDLRTIRNDCNGANVMYGCRREGSDTIQVLAQAPRDDVFFDTGHENDPHVANGVGWYYAEDYSMGFAPEGEEIRRDSCDTVDGAQHVCFHTEPGGGAIGYRCGDDVNLQDGSRSHERIFWTAD